MKPLVTTFASLVLAAAWQPLAVAQPDRGDDDANLAAVAALEQTLVGVIARSEPSVVAIGRRPPTAERPPASEITDIFGDLREPASRKSAQSTVAAGVIIDPAGLILTVYQAVRQGDEHSVTLPNGKTYPATIKAADPRSALAVLAIDPENADRPSFADAAGGKPIFSAIPFGDAERLRKGQFVVAIGNPYAIASDGQPTASWGVVTNMARKAPTGANLNDAPGPNHDHRTTLHHLGTLIQTDAKLGWGAGGGALVNIRGELIGITTTVATIAGHEQPAGYAIPINTATRRIIKALSEGREVEYGLLGISFGIAPSRAGRSGADQVAIQQVYPGSPAARAGLASGDRIEAVDGRPVDDIDDTQLAISILPPGAKTNIAYERDGRPGKVRVTLAKLAVVGEKIITNLPPAWRGIRVDYATALDSFSLAKASALGEIDHEGCVLVSDVEQASAAWQAGVRPGMFISHVAERRVTNPAEFHEAVKDVGSTLDIRLTRPFLSSEEKSGRQ